MLRKRVKDSNVQPRQHSEEIDEEVTGIMAQPSRKPQLSNGYLLEFGQLSRVLHFLAEHAAEKRI